MQNNEIEEKERSNKVACFRVATIWHCEDESQVCIYSTFVELDRSLLAIVYYSLTH